MQARLRCCHVEAVHPNGQANRPPAKGDLWFFPAGFPQSIQGLGPDGLSRFLLRFLLSRNSSTGR
jgi:oxalate decarboxylase